MKYGKKPQMMREKTTKNHIDDVKAKQRLKFLYKMIKSKDNYINE